MANWTKKRLKWLSICAIQSKTPFLKSKSHSLNAAHDQITSLAQKKNYFTWQFYSFAFRSKHRLNEYFRFKKTLRKPILLFESKKPRAPQYSSALAYSFAAIKNEGQKLLEWHFVTGWVAVCDNICEHLTFFMTNSPSLYKNWNLFRSEFTCEKLRNMKWIFLDEEYKINQLAIRKQYNFCFRSILDIGTVVWIWTSKTTHIFYDKITKLS